MENLNGLKLIMKLNKVLNKSDNGLHGYFLEVDLDYPEELHYIHDYPLAPEKIKIEDNMLSPYCP